MPADESFDRSAEDRRPNTPSPAPRDLASASGQANCHRRRDGSAEDRRPNTPSPAPRDQGSASGASASLPDGEGLREGPLLPERVDHPHPTSPSRGRSKRKIARQATSAGLHRPRARRGRSAALLCALPPPAPALQLDHARAAAAVYRDARGDGDRHAGGARVIFLPTAPLHEAARQGHGGAVQAARAAGGARVCRGVGCGAGARGAAAGGLCAVFVWPTASLLEADRARRRSLAGAQTFRSRTLCQVCQAPALKQRKRSWALALPVGQLRRTSRTTRCCASSSSIACPSVTASRISATPFDRAIRCTRASAGRCWRKSGARTR